MKFMFKLNSIIIIVCIYALLPWNLCNNVNATISPSDKLKKKQGTGKRGPQDESVFDRNLIEIEPLASEILNNNAAYYKEIERHFNGTVLGYVTAWNSHGYDVAKLFAKKFDIISPVWFQVVRQAEKYIITGTHDIDVGWLRDVRRKGGNTARSAIKIVPRVIFDKFAERDYTRLLSFEKERSKVNEVIVNMCLEHGFDGIVLEFWLQLSNRVDDQFLYQLVIELSKALKRHNLNFYLVIPPFRVQYPNFFGAKHMDHLWTYVDGFSLMTYDYSTVQRPGANAPLEWVRNSVVHIVPENAENMKEKREKILMGLNMFGSDYTPDGGGSIVASQYLELLKNVKKRLSYSEKDVENFFEIKTKNGRHYVFYPTLHSIYERIKLATELGCGISIWELGQGLDYFYDLF